MYYIILLFSKKNQILIYQQITPSRT